MSHAHRVLATKFDEFVRETTLKDLLPSRKEMISELQFNTKILNNNKFFKRLLIKILDYSEDYIKNFVKNH